MKVRIEFVPEDEQEERVLKRLADSEESMEEISRDIQKLVHDYLAPAVALLEASEQLKVMNPNASMSWIHVVALGHGSTPIHKLRELFKVVQDKWSLKEPKVEVTYVRITEKGDTK